MAIYGLAAEGLLDGFGQLVFGLFFFFLFFLSIFLIVGTTVTKFVKNIIRRK